MWVQTTVVANFMDRLWSTNKVWCIHCNNSVCHLTLLGDIPRLVIIFWVTHSTYSLNANG